MYVNWTVSKNLSGSYDAFKNGNIVQRRVPFEKLKATLSPHHVKGQDWQKLLTQLEIAREGTVKYRRLITGTIPGLQPPLPGFLGLRAAAWARPSSSSLSSGASALVVDN
jgi:hypothetical protein